MNELHASQAVCSRVACLPRQVSVTNASNLECSLQGPLPTSNVNQHAGCTSMLCPHSSDACCTALYKGSTSIPQELHALCFTPPAVQTRHGSGRGASGMSASRCHAVPRGLPSHLPGCCLLCSMPVLLLFNCVPAPSQLLRSLDACDALLLHPALQVFMTVLLVLLLQALACSLHLLPPLFLAQITAELHVPRLPLER